MAGEIDPSVALDGLLEELLSIGATDVVREAQLILIQGRLRQVQGGKSKQKLTVREPLAPKEAYATVAALVASACESAFLIGDARKALHAESIRWEVDLPESSDAMEAYPWLDRSLLNRTDDIPELDADGLRVLQGALANVRRILDDLTDERG